MRSAFLVGFGLCGVPQTLINSIRNNKRIQDLTVVSNNAGNSGDGGLCKLLRRPAIREALLNLLALNHTQHRSSNLARFLR